MMVRMGKVLPALDENLTAFIERQHVFFVASAPDGPDDHVNVSPKGLDTFRVLDDRTVAYLDLTGSGAETVAHLRQNGRITVLFCAFEDKPLILRLYGRGTVLTSDDDGFHELRTRFPDLPGVRSIIRVDVERVQTSCGYGVPLLGYQGERQQLVEWAERRGPGGVDTYQRERNRTSIDGLPALGG